MIISGGQCGADHAGLEVAFINGIETGGFAPKGWRRSDGPNRWLLRDKYNLTEYPIYGYKARTWANVECSDATIRLCVDFNSPGEWCTLNAIKHYNRPYLDINLLDPIPVTDCLDWIMKNNIKILNIAGNTQGKNGYDVFSMTYQYLDKVIIEFRKQYLNSKEN